GAHDCPVVTADGELDSRPLSSLELLPLLLFDSDSPLLVSVSLAEDSVEPLDAPELVPLVSVPSEASTSSASSSAARFSAARFSAALRLASARFLAVADSAEVEEDVALALSVVAARRLAAASSAGSWPEASCT